MNQKHAFLRFKDKGMSLRLRGRVLVELIYVTEKQTMWTQAEMDEFYTEFTQAAQVLSGQAAQAEVPLSFCTVTGRYYYDKPIDPMKLSSEVIPQVYQAYLRQRNFADYKAYADSRKRVGDADEVAIIFVLERGFRAFARPGTGAEYCVMTQGDDEHAIVHELLHLFGAVDLYYPYHIYGLTMLYFPKTAMCTYEGMEVDPLTQYLIGWTDTLSPKAKEFIDRVPDYSIQRNCEATGLEFYRNHEEILLERATPYNSVNSLRLDCAGCNPFAEFLVGLCYRDGIGMEKNAQRAERYFERSGKTGLTIGAVEYAQMLLCRGVKTQEDRMNLWLVLHYNSLNHIKLGAMQVIGMYNGDTGEKREKEAVDLALRYYGGDTYYTDYAKRSLQFYRVAEKYSRNIQPLYETVKKMRMQYEKMLAEGDPDLQYAVGRLLERGQYVRQDLPGAVCLYRIAAKKGNALACQALSRCCREGVGTDRDLNAARYWMAQAELCRKENPWDGFCQRCFI